MQEADGTSPEAALERTHPISAIGRSPHAIMLDCGRSTPVKPTNVCGSGVTHHPRWTQLTDDPRFQSHLLFYFSSALSTFIP